MSAEASIELETATRESAEDLLRRRDLTEVERERLEEIASTPLCDPDPEAMEFVLITLERLGLLTLIRRAKDQRGTDGGNSEAQQ